MPAKRVFTLHYWCENGGDGSVHVRFTDSEESAEEQERQSIEEYGEGWGEPSVSSVRLELDDGKLFLLSSEWDGKGYKNIRKELK